MIIIGKETCFAHIKRVIIYKKGHCSYYVHKKKHKKDSTEK